MLGRHRNMPCHESGRGALLFITGALVVGRWGRVSCRLAVEWLELFQQLFCRVI